MSRQMIDTCYIQFRMMVNYNSNVKSQASVAFLKYNRSTGTIAV